MKNAILVMVHVLARLAVLLGTGGTRAVLAENILLKQQLLVLQRSRWAAPPLRTADRWLFGFCAQFLSLRRLIRTAIILKPATLLCFHRAFKDYKYRFLHSSNPKKKPGPKGPAPELIRAICELKRRNTRFGCLSMANWHSSGDWQFKQPVAMALPTVILKAGWLRCWAARFLPGCVAR